MSVSSRDSSSSRSSSRRRPRLPSWMLNPDDPFKCDPLSIIRPKASRRLSTSDDPTGFFGSRRTRAKSFSSQRPRTAGSPNGVKAPSPLRNSHDFGTSELGSIPTSVSPSGPIASGSTERVRQAERTILLSSISASSERSSKAARPRRPLTMGNFLGDGRRTGQKKSFVGLENYPIPSTPFDPFGDSIDAPLPDMRHPSRKDNPKAKIESKRKRPISFLGRFSPFSRTSLLDLTSIGRRTSSQSARPSSSLTSTTAEAPSKISANVTSLSLIISRPSAIRNAQMTTRPESGSLDHGLRTRSDIGHSSSKYVASPERRAGVIGRIRNAVKKTDKRS